MKPITDLLEATLVWCGRRAFPAQECSGIGFPRGGVAAGQRGQSMHRGSILGNVDRRAEGTDRVGYVEWRPGPDPIRGLDGVLVDLWFPVDRGRQIPVVHVRVGQV